MKNNKLFCFGCSYTSYRWKSWADYLSNYYESSDICGMGGTGNIAIFDNVIATMDDIREGDTVVVQWSGLLRDDKFIDGDWISEGDPFISPYYSNDYLKKYFSIEQKIKEFINYHTVLKNIFKYKKVNYKYFFMLNPLLKFNNIFLYGEPLNVGITLDSLESSLYEIRRYQTENFVNNKPLYDTLISIVNDNNDSYIRESLWEYQSKNQKEDNYLDDGSVDYHATSLTHLNYLKDHILPYLGKYMDEDVYNNLKQISIKEDFKSYIIFKV